MAVFRVTPLLKSDSREEVHVLVVVPKAHGERNTRRISVAIFTGNQLFIVSIKVKEFQSTIRLK